MAQHRRAQIRAAIVQALLAANTLAGTQVHAHRIDPQRVELLPALQVEDAGEQQNVQEIGRPAQCVERTLRIRVIAQATSVDAVDELLGQVEQTFAQNGGFGVAHYNTPSGASDVDSSGELHRPVHARAQSFDVFYTSAQANPWAIT